MDYTQPTPITTTPDDTTFEPSGDSRCPTTWGTVMGFDSTGGTKTQPAGVDYARIPTIQDSSKDVRTGPSNKQGA